MVNENKCLHEHIRQAPNDHTLPIAYKYRAPASIVVAGIGAAQEAWHRQEDVHCRCCCHREQGEPLLLHAGVQGEEARHRPSDSCRSLSHSRHGGQAACPSWFKLANRRWQCKAPIIRLHHHLMPALGLAPLPSLSTSISIGHAYHRLGPMHPTCAKTSRELGMRARKPNSSITVTGPESVN